MSDGLTLESMSPVPLSGMMGRTNCNHLQATCKIGRTVWVTPC